LVGKESETRLSDQARLCLTYVGSRCGGLYKKGKMENNREENIHTMYADNMIAEDEEEKKAVLSRLERYGKKLELNVEKTKIMKRR